MASSTATGAPRSGSRAPPAWPLPAAPPAEPGASVAIVDEGGGRYLLREKAPGTYRSDSLLLSPARRYQVRIATGSGTAAATYESDLVPLKVDAAH
ncbi:MAG: hypothetical protein WKG07_28720 [Hymenobacter sp.]